jgi:integrase
MQQGFTKKRGATWTAYYYTGTGRHRRQHSRGGFRIKNDALRFLNDTIATIQKGEHVEATKLTVGEYLLDRWLPLIEHTVRPSTWDGYKRTLEQHVIPTLGHVQLQRLTVDHLDRLYAELVTHGRLDGRGGLAPKTVRSIHTTLHKALRDAERKQLVRRNVAQAADPPRGGAREMQTWTSGQVRAFLDGMQGHRLYAAYLLAATTGMRRGEVLGVRWRDVDFDATPPRLSVTQTVLSINYKIHFGAPKTKRGRRSIALDPTTVQTLKEHRTRQDEERALVADGYHDHDLVFARADGTPVHPDYFSQAFDRAVLRHQLPKIRLHDLRHTHATLGFAAGIPAKVMSDRLGHATVAFTQDVYMHAIPQLEADAADQVAALIFADEHQPTTTTGTSRSD